MLHLPWSTHSILKEVVSEFIEFCTQTFWKDNKCSTALYLNKKKKRTQQKASLTGKQGNLYLRHKHFFKASRVA